MSLKRHVAAVCGDGRIRLVEENVPEVSEGMVLIRVYASLVSPGTELGGWKHLAALRREGGEIGTPRKFGYSNAGIVEAVGDNVSRFQKGQRVACIGYGFALHSEYAVVPQNLCVPLPDDISYEEGSYSMLLATAMQAVRRAEPALGEKVAVVGMGLVGQLTAQLHQVCGNFVIGWARNPIQIEIADKWGIDKAINMKTEDPVEATNAFTDGRGLDTAVLAFPGKAGNTWKAVCDSMKITPDGHRMGRVVMVGGSEIDCAWIAANMDIRFAARTGPGYHDSAWEKGNDYPPVFVEWTTEDNLKLGLELIRRRKIDVLSLTTHHVPLMEATEAIDSIINEPEKILGLVFEEN